MWCRWAVLALAVLQGGWLVFDGAHALLVGDYVTPTEGPHAGQLGPWAAVVSALGFQPRSLPIKWLHVGLGIAWLLSLVALMRRPGLGWNCLLVVALASLWYLPLGTVIGLGVLALLFTPELRLSTAAGRAFASRPAKP